MSWEKDSHLPSCQEALKRWSGSGHTIWELSCRSHYFTLEVVRLQYSDREALIVSAHCMMEVKDMSFYRQNLNTNGCFNTSVCWVFWPSLVALLHRFCMLATDWIWKFKGKELEKVWTFALLLDPHGSKPLFEESLVPRTIFTWHGQCLFFLWPLDLRLSNAGPIEQFPPAPPSPFLFFSDWICLLGRCNLQVFGQTTQTVNLIVRIKKEILAEVVLQGHFWGWVCGSWAMFPLCIIHFMHAWNQLSSRSDSVMTDESKRGSLDCRPSDHSSGWLCVDV